MSHGRYFEDFEVGVTYRHWPGRTITEHDDTMFSLMTMNQNPLHIDEHYSSQLQHGRRLVNGTFVFSLAVGLSVGDMSLRAIATLVYEDIEHKGPVWHGDTIYAESTVLDKQ
jgi:acyl dehydratase